jgi:UDP-N-acetylglucosamine 3-dehydrogenase
MDKLNCAVIGLGWFGEYHIDTLKQFPTVEVAAICTRTKTRLQELSKKYEIQKTYTDYHDLLADSGLDMVSITTHVEDHFQIAIDSIRAGKHVFLEKPMASNTQECDQILEELEKTDKAFMVGHICRFDAQYAMAKEEIEKGNLGKIVSLSAKRNLSRSITETHLNKLSALFGDGIHDLDLMLWYTDSKLKSVYAQSINTRPHLKYDDIGWALFRFEDGAFAVIETVWSLPDNVPYVIDAKMEIIGTEGMINIDNSGKNFTVITKSGVAFPESKYWPKIHDARSGYLKEEFDYFIKCIINGIKPTVITPGESRDAVHAIRLAEKSARENRIINF